MSITSRALVVVGVVALTSCGSGKLPPGEALPAGGEVSTTTASDETVAPDSPPASAVPEVDVGRSDAEPSVETTTSQSWVDVTSNLVGLESSCGNVSFVSAHPERDQVIAGIALRGLWTLDDATGQWSPLGGGEGSATITNRMMAIEYDPDDPDRFWESGAYGAGAFRTDDGGATFTGLGDLRHLDSISVDMQDESRRVMVAGAHERREVFRSTDGGATWTDISGGLPLDAGNTAYALVLGEARYLVGSYGAEGAGVFLTTDAGASWSRVHAGAVRGLPLIHGEKIYWLLDGAGGVILSTDAGATFQLSGRPSGSRSTNLDMLPDGRLVTVGDNTVVVSEDDGRTWRSLGPPLPFEPIGVAFAERRSALYIWQQSCVFGEPNPVTTQSIMELDVAVSNP